LVAEVLLEVKVDGLIVTHPYAKTVKLPAINLAEDKKEKSELNTHLVDLLPLAVKTKAKVNLGEKRNEKTNIHIRYFTYIL
jgi:hypothetical protein